MTVTRMLHARGAELRAEYEEKWTEEDRTWLIEREKCHCKTKALPSRRYLRSWMCGRCRGWIEQWRVRR
jgi:hypothetical protein